jgi:AraC-like DNA-binding protein
MLIGTYQQLGEVGRRLLDALPVVAVLTDDDWDPRILTLLEDEIVRNEPGQEVVLDRLLDLVLIAVVRAWLSRAETNTPPWYLAYRDPIVGRAVRLLQQHPSHPWTVAGLATTSGVSRAALARRFTELVGEPPMTFLTNWRLTLAADLLRNPDTTLAAVARQVGYSSPFALSAAFKRVRGVSPRQQRRELAAG